MSTRGRYRKGEGAWAMYYLNPVEVMEPTGRGLVMVRFLGAEFAGIPCKVRARNVHAMTPLAAELLRLAGGE